MTKEGYQLATGLYESVAHCGISEDVSGDKAIGLLRNQESEL